MSARWATGGEQGEEAGWEDERGPRRGEEERRGGGGEDEVRVDGRGRSGDRKTKHKHKHRPTAAAPAEEERREEPRTIEPLGHGWSHEPDGSVAIGTEAIVPALLVCLGVRLGRGISAEVMICPRP